MPTNSLLPPQPPMAHRHHHHAVLLHLLTCLLLSSADDSDVMLNLLSTLTPTPAGWSTATPFCNWPNVTCDSTFSFVTAINLDSASLSGRLPSFQNMSFLQTLLLSNNGFSVVPKNFLVGLPNLQTLTISENSDLEPWRIPNHLAESTSLVSIIARNASLTGAIPDIFAPLTNLQNLRLSHNDLTGALPESFSASRIKNLWLNDQKQGLSGGIGVLSTMTELYVVWLHGNMLSGAIPDLSECVDLFDLQLHQNQFTGVVPASLITLPSLANITLQNNKLQGPFPRFPSGVNATIGTNCFCLDKPGPCDPQVAALLDVAAALGYPPLLAEAWVGNDACESWRFVSCGSQARKVTFVNLAGMRFSGSISPAFAKLTALKDLVLSDNNLSGVIPTEITVAALPQLQVLDVSNNNLSGPIPDFPQSVRFLYHGNELLGKNGGGASPPTNGSGSPPMSHSGSPPTNRSGWPPTNGSRPPPTIITGSPATKGGRSSGRRRWVSSSEMEDIMTGVAVFFVMVFTGVVLFMIYHFYERRRRRRFRQSRRGQRPEAAPQRAAPQRATPQRAAPQRAAPQRPLMGNAAANILRSLVEHWMPSGPEEERDDGIDLNTSLPQALRSLQAQGEGTSATLDVPDPDLDPEPSSSSSASSDFESLASSDCR